MSNPLNTPTSDTSNAIVMVSPEGTYNTNQRCYTGEDCTSGTNLISPQIEHRTVAAISAAFAVAVRHVTPPAQVINRKYEILKIVSNLPEDHILQDTQDWYQWSKCIQGLLTSLNLWNAEDECPTESLGLYPFSRLLSNNVDVRIAHCESVREAWHRLKPKINDSNKEIVLHEAINYQMPVNMSEAFHDLHIQKLKMKAQFGTHISTDRVAEALWLNQLSPHYRDIHRIHQLKEHYDFSKIRTSLYQEWNSNVKPYLSQRQPKNSSSVNRKTKHR
ncbi:hypothetical protein BC833DRAFT_602456 [Globomyces pollinis-pini]|nr:hypothetical protein BC833DRAFT_602456 [Globomyces pollinis-pini]